MPAHRKCRTTSLNKLVARSILSARRCSSSVSAIISEFMIEPATEREISRAAIVRGARPRQRKARAAHVVAVLLARPRYPRLRGFAVARRPALSELVPLSDLVPLNPRAQAQHAQGQLAQL